MLVLNYYQLNIMVQNYGIKNITLRKNFKIEKYLITYKI